MRAPKAPTPDPFSTQIKKSAVSLLLVDVVNPMDFEHGAALARRALPMARRLANLKQRAYRHGVPVIYANDNFGQWRSDRYELIEHSVQAGMPGAKVSRSLLPGFTDYFLIKPKQSAFFQTPLDSLLRQLGTRTLVLAGLSANICVLYTANDAHMRDLHVVVPHDGVAAQNQHDHRYALRHLKLYIRAHMPASTAVNFARLRRSAPRSI